MGKRTAQIDAIKDITSDSQVNSYFPYRWSPASLTFHIYFYLFLYLYIRTRTLNNDTSHLKSPKQKSRLGTASIKITVGGRLELVYGRPTPPPPPPQESDGTNSSVFYKNVFSKVTMIKRLKSACSITTSGSTKFLKSDLGNVKGLSEIFGKNITLIFSLTLGFIIFARSNISWSNTCTTFL